MKFVTEEDLKLSYLTFGRGVETVICFHGHSKDAEDFRFLEEFNVKVIAINLFLHGESTFSEARINDRPITTFDVEKMLAKILDQEKVDHFHLLAYSQGGRFVLSFLPHFVHRVKSLQLLAVDGLNDRNFYTWAKRRWWARKLFKRWTKKPNELLGIIRFLNRINVVHPKIHDFVAHYAAEPEKLKLAYQTFCAFRKLRPSTKKLQPLFANSTFTFKLILGEFDQIVTVESGKKFLKKIERPDALTIIPSGHDFFKPESLVEVKKVITFER